MSEITAEEARPAINNDAVKRKIQNDAFEFLENDEEVIGIEGIEILEEFTEMVKVCEIQKCLKE